MKHEHFSGDPCPARASRYDTVAVIGAGSWGTALAATLAHAELETRLWGRDKTVIDDINANARNTLHLPDVPLPTALHGAHEMSDALFGADVVLLVVPSRSMRTVARQVAEHAPSGIPVAVCAKGIEAETGLLMAQVAKEELHGHPIGCVSGPTFARETALGHCQVVYV